MGAASVQSAAIAAGNKEVRLCADVNCRVATGANPTATSTSERIVANAPERFRVTPGDKIAVIED